MLIVILSCVYTIYPSDQVLLTELGAPKAVITDAGLHFKVPFLQYANFMPRQLLNLEAPSEEVIAQDKKRLVVDAFARWRIVDPLKFYQAVPYASQDTAEGLLAPILSSNIRRVLGSQNFATVLVREARPADAGHSRQHESGGTRFRRRGRGCAHPPRDLPQANSDAIYQRMKKERQREANEYRAEGDETAQRVRARART
ncbi:MAG: SPFH domain-containing protein [Rhizomicrobium sp.]